MSDIADRIEALVADGATAEVRLADGQTLGPWPVIYGEYTQAAVFQFWWAELDGQQHGHQVEAWTWDAEAGELHFRCQDGIEATLSNLWRSDHRATLDAMAALPGLENIPYPRDTGSHYA